MLNNGLYYMLAMFALVYALFTYTQQHHAGVSLPVPKGMYYFRPNETKAVLERGRMEAARMLSTVQRMKLAAAADSDSVPHALSTYGIAFPEEGDGANLAAMVDYVHLHHRLGKVVPGLPTELQAAAERITRDKKLEALFSLEELSSIRDALSGKAHSEPVRAHAIICADNGTFSGTHELSYIYAAMRYTTALEVEDCVDVRFGFFERPVRDPTSHDLHTIHVPVLAVTTGIYVTRAAACVASLMSLPMFDMQSATFMGTAGVTPIVGGGGWHPRTPGHPSFHDSEGSGGMGTGTAPSSAGSSNSFWDTVEGQEAAENPTCQKEWHVQRQPIDSRHAPVSIGSVCVTHAAFLQECGLCVEDTPVATLCSRPRCHMHTNPTFFGPCQFSHQNKHFAEEMKAAMYGRPFPAVPDAVQRGMRRFWEANEAVPKYAPVPGSSESIYQRDAPESPILLHCAEAATSNILAGPRSDVLCREYSYQLLGKDGEGFSRDDITCVQAMEGFGFLHVMQQFPAVPVALVRAASNYDMFPLRKRAWQVQADGAPVSDPTVLNLQTRKEMIEHNERNHGGGSASLNTPTTTPTSVSGFAARVRDGASSWARTSELRHAAAVHKAVHEDSTAEHLFTSWQQDPFFMEPQDYLAYTKASYAYAVEASSAVVLNFFLRDDTHLPSRK